MTTPSAPVSAKTTALASAAPVALEDHSAPVEDTNLFFDLSKDLQADYLKKSDGVQLTPEEKARIRETLSYWNVGKEVYFLDLLALDVYDGLNQLFGEDSQRDFMAIYQTLRISSSQLETNRHPQIALESLQKSLEALAAFSKQKSKDLILAFQKTAQPLPKSQLLHLQRLQRNMAILNKYFSDPTARCFFNRYTIDYYLEGPRTNKRHYATFLRFLQTLTRVDSLDANAFLEEEPLQFYPRIAAAYDIAHKEMRRLAKAEQTEEHAVQLAVHRLNFLILDGLKNDFEALHHNTSVETLESRVRDNITTYEALKERNKGPLAEECGLILAKIEARLGDDLSSLLDLKDAASIDVRMRGLNTLDSFPGIMKSIKREIKELYARAASGEFGRSDEVVLAYQDCFETLHSLFIILHDLSAIQNANRYQVNDDNIPPDLMAVIELIFTEEPASPVIVREDSPSPPPLPSPSPPAPPVSAKTMALMPRSAAPIEDRFTERKERLAPSAAPAKPKKKTTFPVPKVGEKCSKVGRDLRNAGFYLYDDTHHRYYQHTEHRHLQIKIKHHGTLSPGERQDIKDAFHFLNQV